MSLLARKRILVAAIEGSPGVDEGPVGADAILTRGLEVIPYAGTFVPRDLDREILGSQGQLSVKKSVNFNFEVEIAGAGVAGDAPKWGRLHRACGFSQTLDSATDAVYAPISASFPTLTMKAYRDGQRHVGLGCRGNLANVRMNPGDIPRFVYAFTGLYVAPASAADPTPDTTDFQIPDPVTFAKTPTCTLHGTSVVLVGFDIQLGNQVEHLDYPGLQEVSIVDRQCVGQMTIHAPTITNKDWFTAVDDRTSGALQIIHGDTSGNKVTIDCPQVELLNPRYGDAQGILTLTLDLVIKPSSTGNDEITFTVA